MGQLVRNERTKLTATYFNGVAVAILAVGALGPIVNVASGQSAVTLFTALSPLILSFHLGCIAFPGETHFEGIEGMNIAQFLTLMIAPVGALGFGFIMLYITRKDRQQSDLPHKPNS